MEKYIESSNKIVIWGAGNKLDTVYSAIDSCNCVVGIIDSNQEKQNQTWNGIKIYSPDILDIIEYDYIIISLVKYETLRDFIISKGIDQKKVISFWSGQGADSGIFDYFKAIKVLDKKKEIYRNRLINYEYEIDQTKKLSIASIGETIDYMLVKGVSLARFGDGELDLMLGKKRSWFQDCNVKICRRLNEVFNSNNENIAIAIADNFGSLSEYTEKAADDIREYVVKSRDLIEKKIDYKRKYFNTYVTRPYLVYRDKSLAGGIFSKFKQLWKDRNLIIIEGEHSKIGVRNDLLDSARSIRRVLCPQSNSWTYYDEIFDSILTIANKEDIILISLGPTATVLSFDLALEGYQSIDIGHLDNEYEWFLGGYSDRVAIPGKFTSEVVNFIESDLYVENDELYLDSIVKRIGT